MIINLPRSPTEQKPNLSTSLLLTIRESLFTMKTIEFISENRTFSNDRGQTIDYTARNIIIDGIPFKVAKNDGKVFDLQFKDYINNGPLTLDLDA